MKQCNQCKQTLPTERFYQKSAKRVLKSGQHVTYKYPTAKCIDCILEYDRNRKKSGAYIHPKYGITTEEWNTMLEQQDGACAICGVTAEEYGKRFSIDHCHTTGVIRGLLCMHCNTALGHFRDDVESLERAVKYLEKVNETV